MASSPPPKSKEQKTEPTLSLLPPVKKHCGKRASKDVLSRQELVALWISHFPQRSLPSHFTKKQLCHDLGLPFVVVVPSRSPSTEKVCSARISKQYPFRWTKQQLQEEAVRRGIPNATTTSYEELCRALSISIISLPRSRPRILPSTTSPQQGQDTQPFEFPGGSAQQKKSALSSSEPQGSTGGDCLSRGRLPLLQHQIRVIRFLQNHRGVIAVHKMGSGKTMTAVAASQCYLDEHPDRHVVVVAPLTLLKNFEKEMDKYGPHLRYRHRYHFYSFQEFYSKTKSGTIGIDHCHHRMVIIDEAHNLRTEYHPATERRKAYGVFSKAVVDCARRADKVLLLTATPVVNFASDIAPLLMMLEPIQSPVSISRSEIHRVFEKETPPSIRAFLRPLLRCKFSYFEPPAVHQDVQEDEEKTSSSSSFHFPKRRNGNVQLLMNPSFYRLYTEVEEREANQQTIFANFGGKTKDLSPFHNGIRRAINILNTLSEAELLKSPKIRWILDYITKHPGRKTVIFSHFLDMGIEAIRKRLDQLHVHSGVISGKISETQRQQTVHDFNEDNITVLFLSKAGGEGIDLKGGRTVILMEPAWNRNTEEQVIGRVIRNNSHRHLPKDEQQVDVFFLYLLKPKEWKEYHDTPEGQKLFRKITNGKFTGEMEERLYQNPSADILLKLIANRKEKDLHLFLETVKEVSIETNPSECSS